MMLAPESSRPRDLRAAVRAVAMLEDHEKWDEIAELTDESLSSDATGSDRDRVILTIAGARAAAKRGHLADAWQRLRDLRPALGALRDDDLAAEWHCAMSAVLFRQGDMHGAATEADDCLRLAHGGRRSAFLRGIACQTLALVAQHGGDWPAARRLLRKAIDTFGECGAETRETRAQMNLCSVLVWAGEWDEFETTARDVLAAAERLQAPRLMKQVLLQAAMVARGRGQRDRAHDYLDRVRQVRPAEQDPREAALAREIEGDVLLDAGDALAAFHAYDEVVQQGQTLALGRDIVFEGLRKRAEAAFALGDLARAACDAQLAMDEARDRECVIELGAALRVLAQVAWAQGDSGRAAALAGESVQVLARVRERFERARTLGALADVLPDPVAARHEAIALARALGARTLLAELQVTRPDAWPEPRRVLAIAADTSPAFAPAFREPPGLSSAAVGETRNSADPLFALAPPAADLPLPAFHLGDACVLSDMARVLAHGGDALLEGDAGTETREVAVELHRRSGRRGLCVIVDAAAIAADDIAAVLFGVEAEGSRAGGSSARDGATGHVRERAARGALERAADGTLIVHHVTALPATVQGALAHALQARVVYRLGGGGAGGGGRALAATVYLTTRVRLPIALSEAVITRDLGTVVQYNRLYVPPLQHRPDDLVATLDRLWAAMCQRWDKEVALSTMARTALLHAPWEGNAGEMEIALETIVRAAPAHGTVSVTDLDSRYAACALRRPVPGLVQQEHEFLVERVQTYLRAAQYNYARAARLAGYTRSGFLKLVVRLGLKEDALDASRATSGEVRRGEAPCADICPAGGAELMPHAQGFAAM